MYCMQLSILVSGSNMILESSGKEIESTFFSAPPTKIVRKRLMNRTKLSKQNNDILVIIRHSQRQRRAIIRFRTEIKKVLFQFLVDDETAFGSDSI